MLDQPGLTILLAFLDGNPVATLTLVIVPNLTRGCAPYAIVENVVTLTSCRGKGIGKRLMKDGIDLCWEAGCFKIMPELFPTHFAHLMRMSCSLGQAGHEARCGASRKWHNAADGPDILTRCGTHSSKNH
ncbi:GNAT family N-acetyltransferase [Roseibium sp. MMSF_3412]|uniref:GNAT family N-acetyltransferase n=1 Tax=Roseibium sp. MMSF_3412 TaxID=3046712 RepID=UPI00273F5327|nr:GNAT family N-acetyltransferase [Roseibium sp. MMSF_3412]